MSAFTSPLATDALLAVNPRDLDPFALDLRKGEVPLSVLENYLRTSWYKLDQATLQFVRDELSTKTTSKAHYILRWIGKNGPEQDRVDLSLRRKVGRLPSPGSRDMARKNMRDPQRRRRNLSLDEAAARARQEGLLEQDYYALDRDRRDRLRELFETTRWRQAESSAAMGRSPMYSFWLALDRRQGRRRARGVGTDRDPARRGYYVRIYDRHGAHFTTAYAPDKGQARRMADRYRREGHRKVEILPEERFHRGQASRTRRHKKFLGREARYLEGQHGVHPSESFREARRLHRRDTPRSVLAREVKGKRVQLHPGTDRWMMGDRYGTVQGLGRLSGTYRVKMDRSGDTITVSRMNIGEWL